MAGAGMTAGSVVAGVVAGGVGGGEKRRSEGGSLVRQVSQGGWGNSHLSFPFLIFSLSTCLWTPHLY